jgi:hypothetical protein
VGLTAWYIDAWSVLDGIAFASQRGPRDWDAPVLTPAVTTVLIGPPDWRAVGIAKLTTALAATRGTFQEGVFDEEDAEIAFDSLDDVREVVRRAYLAGGLGLDDPGEAAPFTPEIHPKSGGEDRWNEIRHILTNIRTDDDRRMIARQMIALFDEPAVQHQAIACVQQLTSAMVVWKDAKGADSKSDQLSALQFTSILDSAFFGAAGVPIRPELYPVTSQQRLRLVFRLPAMGHYPKVPRLRTLGDQLLLAFASGECLATLQSFERFLPVAAAALIVAAAADPGPFGKTAFAFEPWVTPAMTWLCSALPRRVDGAPERMVEELIVRIAEHRLGFGGAHDSAGF